MGSFLVGVRSRSSGLPEIFRKHRSEKCEGQVSLLTYSILNFCLLYVVSYVQRSTTVYLAFLAITYVQRGSKSDIHLTIRINYSSVRFVVRRLYFDSHLFHCAAAIYRLAQLVFTDLLVDVFSTLL